MTYEVNIHVTFDFFLHLTKNRLGIVNAVWLIIIIPVAQWNIALLNVFGYGFKLKDDEVFFAW